MITMSHEANDLPAFVLRMTHLGSLNAVVKWKPLVRAPRWMLARMEIMVGLGYLSLQSVAFMHVPF